MVKHSEDPADVADIECVSEVMKCSMRGCDENTMAFQVAIEKCDVHIPDMRVQCLAKGRRHCLDKKVNLEGSVLWHWCFDHSPNFKSLIFKIRSKDFKALYGPSTDFTLTAAGESITVISGRNFDAMARKYSYSTNIKENLRGVIQRYLKCSGVGLISNPPGIYRDHLAIGWVYILQYSNYRTPTYNKLSLKIGYSSDVSNRFYSYNCGDMYPYILAQVPSSSDPEKSRALWGVHLLEQILHAVHVENQNDRVCYCGVHHTPVVHGEIFDFEPVPGFPNEMEAGLIRVEELTAEMNEWADIIRDAEGAFRKAYNIYHV